MVKLALIIKTSTFDQILCLKEGKFDLIKISSVELFSVQNTSRISHAYSLFASIIQKEKSILTKLQQFMICMNFLALTTIFLKEIY